MSRLKNSEFVVTYKTDGRTTVLVMDSDKVDMWAAMNAMQARINPGVTVEARQADRRRADEILRRARAQ